MEGAVAVRGYSRRRAVAFLSILVASGLPFLVFHGTFSDSLESDFRMSLAYLVSGWVPWFLIVVGSLCFVPVAVSIGRSALSRWWLSPQIRHAYEAWGVTLYFLGVVLALQTSQVASAF